MDIKTYESLTRSDGTAKRYALEKVFKNHQRFCPDCRSLGFGNWAKERRFKHHGISPLSFPFSLKELEFRYNHRKDNGLFGRLVSFMSGIVPEYPFIGVREIPPLPNKVTSEWQNRCSAKFRTNRSGTLTVSKDFDDPQAREKRIVMSRKTAFKEYYWCALLLLILGSLALMVIAACCGNRGGALRFAWVLLAVCLGTLVSYKFYPPPAKKL